MSLLKDKLGLTTDGGTNAIAAVLFLLEYSKTFSVETQKWLAPLLMTLLCVIFYLIRGTLKPEVVEKINEVASAEEALEEGREP
jgi:hypothetical protein